MTSFHRYLRLSWVAIAAIAGVLSAAGDVSAASTRADQGPGRACCLGRTCAKCCCPPASDVTNLAPAAPSPIVSSGGARLSAPAPLCECRPGGPTSPASKDEPLSPEDRGDQATGHAVELAIESLPAIVVVRLIPPPASPPKAPLFLRTSRLLI